jgi:hypothetical protein
MLGFMSIKIQVILFCAVVFVGLNSCHPEARDGYGQPIADSSIEKGAALAATYCGSCHQLPDPALLNKLSWQKGVLPAMGPRLGIFYYKGEKYPSYVYDPLVGAGFYPSRPILTAAQWQNILDYYSGTAPDSLGPQPAHAPIREDLALFQPVTPDAMSGGATPGAGKPITCMVKIDTSRRQLFTGRVFPGILSQYDAQLHRMDTAMVYGGVVDMSFMGDSAIACNIGNINPNNGQVGYANRVHFDAGGKMRVDSIAFLKGLERPVQLSVADLNGDGRKDLLVCEFGHQRGALSWMENTGKGDNYIRHILRAQPGAIRAYVQDANGDGLPDVWALFAQGDEGIFLFINKGHGKFEEQRVLRFPPVYGSSYFELADINKDGSPDIIYTCGDNGDYSAVLKPYHGVYIYLNDGHNHFTQSFFYPINGCYKAIARDFDGDGDLDLATISFFADYAKHPEEGFVYLENLGGMQFQPHSLPAATAGRWITMDAGDLDGDGKIDLVLGNFAAGPTITRNATDWKKGPPFLLLHNIGKSAGH